MRSKTISWRGVASPHVDRCAAAVLSIAALTTGCALPSGGPHAVHTQETFDSTNTYTRSFRAPLGQTCEAARRALLSQGYVVLTATTESVHAKKSFQPANETHMEIEMRIVCARERGASTSTLAFATALQDRYALKKSNNSASVGVGAIGSLSLPFTSSDDSLVKVASETVTTAPFYARFFTLLERYLAASGDEPQPVVVTQAAPPAAAASAPAMSASATAPAPSAAQPPAPLAAPAPARSASEPAVAASSNRPE